MTCREAIDLLADYLDATLSSAAGDRLEAHLRLCEECRAYVATYRATRTLSAEVGRVPMPAEMKERLREFLLDQLVGER